MNRTVIIFLLFLASSSLCAQHLFTERSVKRGEILNAYIYPSDTIKNSRFTLVDNQGRVVSRTDGFAMVVEEKIVESALMGIPSDIPAGRYTLKVFCETDEGSDQFSKPFFVGMREFKEMDIPLNGDMTNLRSSDDPRKAEQSRRLWAVISTFNDESKFDDGHFDAPVANYWESAFFGDKRQYLYSDGTTSRTIHNGSDFAAVVGEPVFAPGSGKVVMAEDRILTGNTIVIEHMPGVFSLYYHLDSISIEADMLVKRGMEIGKVGKTGLVTGPHLHWELRVSGIAVDPLRYMEIPLIDKEEIFNIIKSIH